MTEPLRIPIRSDWNAATYDSLDETVETDAVFVGRETLIAPLVAEICEPNKRGTYLISGYRGAGKTTLLIEALRRAQKQLPKDHRLFPLVLNVSEVSASLGTTETVSQDQLDINPRRLLIALLRTIDHRLRRLAVADAALKPLAQKARFNYQKATASKFLQSDNTSQETKVSRTREFALALENKNVLKTIGWGAAAAAIALETVAIAGPTLGRLHSAALALAGVFGVTITAAYKLSSSDTRTAAEQTAFEYDNSLHQLETDLKDILISLKENKLRTVVVMEELDKIEDPEGRQLAAVIRYFKNLFTQAPALFFFVTDKSYFDLVASAIKRARRNRSYAVEHTFFTHRLFVGRPTTEESLQFIKAITPGEADRKRIAKVAETLGKPSRIDEVDLFGQFVRCVLFHAANHLFDLKNELRRFVRNEDQMQADNSRVRLSSFVIDDQTLPPEEAALAVFQDLIVEKGRSFEIKGGRAYANETLADSLYAVFNELGSTKPQRIDSFMPVLSANPDEGLLLDEQLDLNEVGRVREAVRSLIGDLERGRALTRDPKGETFTWREDAARAFRYVRQLEKHEEFLVAELQRQAALVAPLGPVLPPGFETVWRDLEMRVSTVREGREPMTADAAASELRGLLDSYAATMTTAFSTPLEQLRQFGFILDPVAQGLAGSLYYVKPISGDVRYTTGAERGGVLLAFGETETLVDDVWSFVRPESSPDLPPIKRLALVHVIHAIGSVGAEVENRKTLWQQALAQRAGANSDFRSAVDVVALVDPTRDASLTTAERIAAALAGFGAWSRPEQRPYEPLPDHTKPFGDELKTWIDSDSRVFVLNLSKGDKTRPFVERDVLEHHDTVVLDLAVISKGESESLSERIAGECLLKGFDQSIFTPELRKKMGDWLLSTRRVIPYYELEASDWTVAEIFEDLKNNNARVIFNTSGPLPEELQAFKPLVFSSVLP